MHLEYAFHLLEISKLRIIYILKWAVVRTARGRNLTGEKKRKRKEWGEKRKIIILDI